MANLNTLVVDTGRTLGVCKFLRMEESYEYVDGKRSEKQNGWRVFLLSPVQAGEVSVTVENVNIPTDLKMLEDVAIEGVTVTPYVRRNGNFSNIDYSVKAQNLKRKE